MAMIKQLLLSIILLSLSVTTFAEDTIKVKMTTTMGDIVLELYPDKAPETVKNFVNYVENHFYRKTIFHRIIDGFMIQGGGFTNAMARTRDPHSATAQFFINLKNNDFLNHTRKTMNGWGYTVFGKVIKGMDVVDKIAKVKTTQVAGQQNIPVDPIYIEDIKVIK